MRDRTSPRTGRLRRFLRRLCWVFGIIVALYVLTGLVCDVLVWAEWRRIAREGDPVSLAELAEPMPPASENGALVYEKAFRLMGSEKLNYLQSLGYPDELKKDPLLWKKAEASVPYLRPVIELSREAAGRPECRFKAEWEKGFVPHIYQVHVLAKLLENYALLLEHNTTRSQLEPLRFCVRIADALRPEKHYLALMIRSKEYARIGEIAYGMASRREVSESQALALSDALGRGGFESQFRVAARSERVMGVYWLELAAKRQLPDATRDDYDEPQIRFECSFWGRPMLRADELQFLVSQRKIIGRAGIPLRDLPKPPDEPETYTGWQPRTIWPLSNLLDLTPDPYNPYPERRYVDDMIARINGARVAVALRIYKQRFGDFPEKLADLKKLGWKLDLIDPFTGREFAYKRIGEGLLLYSIGPDLKDQHGTPLVDGQWDQGGDIVWKMKS